MVLRVRTAANGPEPDEIAPTDDSPPQKTPASTPASPPAPPSPGSFFECNICFDTPRDPVVTQCGHLYCWSCLFRWMSTLTSSPTPVCPVCKAVVHKDRITPIYGRGTDHSVDPRLAPPRPAATREDLPDHQQGGGPGAVPAAAATFAAAAAHAAQFGPFGGIRAAAAAAYGAGAETTPPQGFPGPTAGFSFGTFGLFPSLFGMHFAYPQAAHNAQHPLGQHQVPHRDQQHPLTPEQETQEFMSRMLIMVALFIIFCLLFF